MTQRNHCVFSHILPLPLDDIAELKVRQLTMMRASPPYIKHTVTTTIHNTPYITTTQDNPCAPHTRARTPHTRASTHHTPHTHAHTCTPHTTHVHAHTCTPHTRTYTHSQTAFRGKWSGYVRPHTLVLLLVLPVPELATWPQFRG